MTTTAATRPAPHFIEHVRPVLERRCVVCHGCYDAPCQLKLQDYAGLARGATTTAVYDGTRLVEATPTRLHQDADTTEGWRRLGFHPVIPMDSAAPATHLPAALMSRMLALRRAHPLPTTPVLPATFDFTRERVAQCPGPEEFDAYATEFPLWSMPFGLPDLPADEHLLLEQWLAAGAPAAVPRAPPSGLGEDIATWERFFNGDGYKQQLAARYLYEHLFLAHLYMEDAGDATVFFKLVRSRTPPGKPVDIIATRRPFDDPGVARVYYRLWADPESVIDKTHMPYALDAARMRKWRDWFLDAEYEVTRLPGYDAGTAANPFIAFESIPQSSRHRFLLDEAEFTIMNFIKGPVCRGSVALNVIQDHFWVFFSAPGFLDTAAYGRFLAEQEDHLRLPAEAGGALWSVAQWIKYARAQRAYLRDKLAFIHDQRDVFDRGKIEVIWDGDGHNPNAALTVFRHHDSASVVRGLVGQAPKTAWVIDYPILERIHYLLVAGFDVFGSAAHQAMTRLYMDFLRMESEMNFLAFLPPSTRQAEIANWYRDAVDEVRDYVETYFTHDIIDPLYQYRTDDHKDELFAVLRARVAPALEADRFALENADLPETALDALQELPWIRGGPASHVPETVLINIRGGGVMTLLSNRAYTNIASMFDEDDRRLPPEDSLTVVNGVLGAYPNAFLEVTLDDIPRLVADITDIEDEARYVQLLDRYGVRRTSPRFWPLSDEVHAKHARARPLAAGILDYNRLENR
ncbi:MAG: fatty acid cis/trans isomerase [Gammaproteobacteria bacterium]